MKIPAMQNPAAWPPGPGPESRTAVAVPRTRRRLLAIAVCLAMPVAVCAAVRVAILTDAVSGDYRRTMEVAIAEEVRRVGDGTGEVAITWHPVAREGDREEQARLLRAAAAEPFDAVLLAPIDRKVLAPAVDAARQAGAKVICFGGVVDSPRHPPTVTADDRALGRTAARTLGERLHGRGRVILLRRQIHAAMAEQREEGFIETLSREFPSIELVATDYHAGPSASAAQKVMATLLERYGRNVQGLFVSTEISAQGALAALRQAGLTDGHLQIAAVDEGNGFVRAAQANGEIQAVLAVDLPGLARAAACLALGEKLPVSASNRWVLDTGREWGMHAEDASPWPALPEMACTDRANAAGGRMIPGLNLVMVEIPAGSVQLGRDDGTKVTAGISRPFWLGRCEVTQQQWMLLMDGNPSDFTAPCLPVDNVSWNDAADFCRRLTVREQQAGRLPAGYVYVLPTEAQWQYACQAGVGPVEISPDNGWCRANSGQVYAGSAGWRMSTHPVGMLQPNAWGLCDMLGNVAEWCADWSDGYPAQAAVDYAGPVTGTHRALRGGSWWSDPQNCRSDHRHRAPPDRQHSGLGFRVALVPVSSSPS